nr:cytochrome b [Scatoglyphus polytrematus]
MKKFNLSMKDPILLMINNSLMSLPTPTSISFLWNMGFLLGIMMTFQIITGLFLSMNYVSEMNMALESVFHITRDIDSGWLMRYCHMNGASMLFILIYSHLTRALYFESYSKSPQVWMSGLILLLMTMATAFLGYVLPWGQMSFWGATVITSMISSIPYLGKNITQWLWGNFSVSQPTLNRFFSLHFILPMIIMAMILIHLILLHQSGSSNPLGFNPNYDKMKFFPYSMTKDSLCLLFTMMILTVMMMEYPLLLEDVENFNKASMTTTPAHIQPEWYFLFAYAILRSIPSKLGGVMAMIGAILLLGTLIMKKSSKVNKKFNPIKKLSFWTFITITILLSWIGANPVEQPFVTMGKFLSILYFTFMQLV